VSNGLRQRAAIAADHRRPPFSFEVLAVTETLFSAGIATGGAVVSTSGVNALMVAPALSRSALPTDHLKQINYRLPLLVMKSIANTAMPE
jgi:hypothetical protein